MPDTMQVPSYPLVNAARDLAPDDLLEAINVATIDLRAIAPELERLAATARELIARAEAWSRETFTSAGQPVEMADAVRLIVDDAIGITRLHDTLTWIVEVVDVE